MKKVIDGVTYNTDTSTAVARSEQEAEPDGYDPKSFEWTLYQTRGGAFFLHTHSTWGVKKDGEWIDRESHEFAPMDYDEAHKWVMEGEVEVLSDVFPLPPEAAAEPVSSATIYLRVPNALKEQIEKKAEAAKQSVNVWAMRCLEQCSSGGRAGGKYGIVAPVFVPEDKRTKGERRLAKTKA